MKNIHYSTSTFCLCPYSGVHFACPPHKSPSWPNPKGTQHGAQGPEPQLCSTQPQNCSRSSSEKGRQDFSPSYPRNPTPSLITESTRPPSPLISQALAESLLLTLLHRLKFPFIFHLFSFLPERQRRAGFLSTTNPNGALLQCITLWSPSIDGNAYLHFCRNNNFALLI